MDSGKQMIFEDRRKKAAKEVILRRVGEHTFNVVDKEGNFKYKVSTVPGKEDCECKSFVENNTKKHDDATGQFFLCKHIYAAQYVESLEETVKQNSTHTQRRWQANVISKNSRSQSSQQRKLHRYCDKTR